MCIESKEVKGIAQNMGQAAEMHQTEAKDVVMEESTRNENGYNHSAELIDEAMGIDIDGINDKMDALVESKIFQTGDLSRLSEYVELNFSAKEIVFLAANGIVVKLNNPLAGLMSMLGNDA